MMVMMLLLLPTVRRTWMRMMGMPFFGGGGYTRTEVRVYLKQNRCGEVHREARERGGLSGMMSK